MTEKRWGFSKGGRVEATDLAYINGVFKRKHAPIFGTVVGFSRVMPNIMVRREGQKTTYAYHADFWKPAPPPPESGNDAQA